MLKPFDCHITVVRNRIEEMDGVDEVLAAERYVDALAGVDLVVLALPLTADTEEMISLTELEMMESQPGSSTSPAASTSSPTTWCGPCRTA